MKRVNKWTCFVNKGSLSLLFFGLFVNLAFMGFHSNAEEIMPWIQNIYNNPFIDDKSNFQFLLTSFLVPAIAYLLGITTNVGFLLLNLLILIFGIVYIYRKLAELGKERFFVYTFLMFSISATLLLWFGKSDALFFVLSSLLILYRTKPVVLFIVAFFLALTHFEQTLVVVLMFGFILLNDFIGERNLKLIFLTYLSVVIAITLAKLLLIWFFWVNGFELSSTRVDVVISGGIFKYFEPILKNYMVFLYSIMGVFWLVFFNFYKASSFNNPGFKLIFISVFIIAIIVSIFTLDTTRVFSIIFWPFILYLLLIIPNYQLDKIFNRRITPLFLTLALLVPTLQLKGAGSQIFFGSITYQTLYK